MFEHKADTMETTAQHQEELQYAQVYISDMPILKHIFIQNTETKKITADFGIPFLLVKKKNRVVAFASLIIKENGKIGVTAHEKRSLTPSEKKTFILHAETYAGKNNTANFRNPEQLKSSIYRMIDWLND